MPHLWDADIHLPPARIAALIESQFLELAPVRVEALGRGWDNVAVRVNGRYVFRFPRRKLGAALIEREARALPLLAPHLPLPVPVPRFLGRPEGDYPYPFAGYHLIPGTTACGVGWTEEQRTRNAIPLGRFLAALHAVPIDPE